MRKLLFSPILLLAFNAIAQVSPPPQPGPVQAMQMPEFIVPVQMGTDTLKNGKATVTLTPQTLDEMKQGMASPDYVVILTPKGDCGVFYLDETKPDSFIVKRESGSVLSKPIFDYVVYVKQKRPARLGRPMPPMPPVQGAQQPAPPPAQQGQQ